jgi:DNA repair exonuclease SbcCD nuclease subunit
VTDSHRPIRFILFADTHLGFDYPIRPRVQRRRRGEEFFTNYRRVLAHAARVNADFIVHGGDFFFRSKVPAKIVDLAYAPLFEFAEKIPVYIVPGNHERSVLPVSLYLSHPNIHVFIEPRSFTLRLHGTRVTLSGFPFQRKDIRGRFESLLAQTGSRHTASDARLLCMHQTVAGATVGPSDYRFRSGQDVIRSADLPPDFDAVLSGHIHRKQILRPCFQNRQSVPVIYPGSTQPTSFAEKDEVKGFFEIEILQHPQAGCRLGKTEFHPLPTRPMQEIVLDSRASRAELVARLQCKLAELDKDAIIRLKWRGPPNAETEAVLTIPYLRSIIPPSMNFQLRPVLSHQRNYPRRSDSFRGTILGHAAEGAVISFS